MLNKIREYFNNNRHLKNIFLVYFFLTFVIGYLDFDRRVTSFEGSVECLKRAVTGEIHLPMRARILAPYTIYFFHKISHIPLGYAYASFRFIFYFLSFMLFHIYLKKWFDDKLAMIGTLSLIAFFPLTLTNWYSIPTDMPELIAFILGAMWIRDNKYKNLLWLIPIATINRETTIALVALYFVNGFGKEKPHILARRTTALFLLCIIPFITLGLIFGFKVFPSFWWALRHNWEGLSRMFTSPNPYNHYYFLVYLCGFYWVLAFKDFRKKEFFLKRSMFVVAAYFLYAFLRAGAINEIRAFVPFCIFVIPLGLFSLFKEDSKEA